MGGEGKREPLKAGDSARLHGWLMAGTSLSELAKHGTGEARDRLFLAVMAEEPCAGWAVQACEANGRQDGQTDGQAGRRKTNETTRETEGGRGRHAGRRERTEAVKR